MPSNVENILGAILTGDGSGIQKPASRVEELLFEIYEQGGGGGDSVIGGIKLTIDSDYVMTVTLVDKDGEEYGVGDDIDLPLETMVVDGTYDPQTQKIKLELKNGNFVEFSVAELVSGLQTELSSDNKLNPTYIAYDASHRAVSDTEKNTWNAKQNAISDLEAIRSGAAAGATAVQPATMTEALAAKQNSLSETQLAAVNSGINSTKVAQISTNQTNILYVSDHIGKNLADLSRLQTTSRYNATFTLNADYTVSVTTSAATSANATCKLLVNEADNNYIPNTFGGCIVSGAPASSTQSTHYLYLAYSNDGSSQTGSGIYIAAGQTVTINGSYPYVQLFIIVSNGVNIGSTPVVYKPMICSPEQYNISPAYAPYALPNSDLTYLEAEDRAALAEVVDSGAKNKLDCNVSTLTPLNTYGSWIGSTYSINSGTTSFVVNSNLTITASKSDTGTARSMTFANYADGSVLNGMVISGGTSNVTIIVQKNGGNYETYATSEGDGALISGIAANTAVRIVASIASAVTCSNVVIKPMLCTKAAFGVSSKFVPYRPNYDLVVSKLPVAKYVNYAITTADTWEEVEALRFTVPTGKIVSIIVAQTFSNIKPLGVEVCVENNSDKIKTVAHFEDTSSYTALSASGIYNNTSGAPKTLYVFVRAQGTGTNTVTLCYQICN